MVATERRKTEGKKMKAFLVQSLKDHDDLPMEQQNHLYNIDDEDFTSKKAAAAFIEKETSVFNKIFKTEYTGFFLFGDIIEGRQHCRRCGAFFWDGEDCDC